MRIPALLPSAMLLTSGFMIAPAQAQDDLGKVPKVVAEVIECQDLADGTARLACFDRTVSALDKAQRSRDVLIADKEQIRKARKGLFGLNVPAARIFDSGEKGDGKKDEAEDIDQIESVIQSARQVNGQWNFVIEDGAQWRQTDHTVLYKEPTPGKSKILISRAALGSYFAKVDGARAMRVKRIID